MGLKPSSPDSRTSWSWKLGVQGLRAQVEFCHSARSAPAKAPQLPLEQARCGQAMLSRGLLTFIGYNLSALYWSHFGLCLHSGHLTAAKQ